MPISCHFRDCKALLVTSLSHVSGAVASVQTFTFSFTFNAGTCHIAEVLGKTTSSRKISLKSGNYSCWVISRKRLSIWRPSAILNLFYFKFRILSRNRHRVWIMLLCTKFHQNRMIFRWEMAILRFLRWRIEFAILIFQNLGFVALPLSSRYSACASKILNKMGQSAAELWSETIFNMAAVRHREFCCCVPHFIKTRWFFVEIMAI